VTLFVYTFVVWQSTVSAAHQGSAE